MSNFFDIAPSMFIYKKGLKENEYVFILCV